MPTNIVDSPAFTSPIVAPANGDPVDGDGLEVLGQGLANRTARHEVLMAYADYTTTFTTASETLTLASQVGGFSLQETNTAIKFPANGVYEVSVIGNFANTSTSNPAQILIPIELGNVGDGYNEIGSINVARFTATNTWEVNAAARFIVTVANKDTEYLHLGIAGTVTCRANAHVLIRRVG